jgi:hypothetical protein
MLRIHCPRHGCDVLVGHRQILGIEGQGADMTVLWRCWCGHRGTVRPHDRRLPVVPAAPAA